MQREVFREVFVPLVDLLEVDTIGGVDVLVVVPMPRMVCMVWMVRVGLVVVVVVLAAGDGGHHEAAFAPKLRVLQVAQLMHAAARVHRRVEPAQQGVDRSIVQYIE